MKHRFVGTLSFVGSTNCVLVVDDEPLNRELLGRLLHTKYEVKEAEDAHEALEILETLGDTIRVVLCDQLMPGLTGTQLSKIVHAKWPHITFLLLTGIDEGPDITMALQAGWIKNVIAKPFRITKLLPEIASCFSESSVALQK